MRSGQKDVLRIVLADDHPIVRLGLRTLILAAPDMRMEAECGDGLKAVQLAESLLPDVLLVDIAMPGLNGLEVIRQVRQRARGVAIIAISAHADESYVLRALRNGAS